MLEITKEELEKLLRHHKGNLTQTAANLGIARSTLTGHVERKGIDIEAIKRETEDAKPEDVRIEKVEVEVTPQQIVQAEGRAARAEQKAARMQKTWKELVRRADMTDQMIQSITPLLSDIRLPAIEPPSVDPRERSPITLKPVANDWHCGKVFDSDMINGINAYSPNIMARRVQKYSDVIAAWVSNYQNMGHTVERIIVPAIGDLVNGELHPEDESNYAGPMTQVVDLSLVFAQFIWEIAHLVPKLDIIWPAGDNHSRLTRYSATSAKAYQTTLNTVIGHMVSLMLAEVKHVNIHVAHQHQVYYQVYDKTWGACHGNMLKGGGGQLGIPAYGMRRHHDGNIATSVILAKQTMKELSLEKNMSVDDRMTAMYDALSGLVDHTLIGHFHQRSVLEFAHGDVHVMPALMGSDPFAVDALRKPGSAPRQVMYACHPRHDIIGEHVVEMSEFKDLNVSSRYNWGISDTSIDNMNEMWRGFVDNR